MGVDPANGKATPNGVDFWWDSFPTNTGNCWHNNTAAAGKTVTTSPAGLLPSCTNGIPSIGIGSLNEVELLACFGATQTGGYNAALCPWFVTPPKPGSSALPLTTAPIQQPSAQMQAGLCRTYREAQTALCKSQ